MRDHARVPWNGGTGPEPAVAGTADEGGKGSGEPQWSFPPEGAVLGMGCPPGRRPGGSRRAGRAEREVQGLAGGRIDRECGKVIRDQGGGGVGAAAVVELVGVGGEAKGE